MKYRDLPKDIRGRAKKNAKESPYNRWKIFKKGQCSLSYAFYWRDTKEGCFYWGLVDDKQYSKARELLLTSNNSEVDSYNTVDELKAAKSELEKNIKGLIEDFEGRIGVQISKSEIKPIMVSSCCSPFERVRKIEVKVNIDI